MSKNLQNVLLGLALLIGSGVATWLFLPMAAEPVDIRLPEWVFQTVIQPFSIGPITLGPIQAGHLLLLIVLIAAGAPFAGLVMGLIVRWLSGIVPAGVSSPAPAAAAARKPAAPVTTTETAGEATGAELPASQKLLWSALILAAIVAIVFLMIQVLPPGFTLF